MKRLLLIVFFIIFYAHNTHAWNLIHPSGGRSLSLGNCSVTLNDFWSCNNNLAGITSLQGTCIGLSYSNKFMMKELGYKNIGITYNSNIGVFLITASQFGYEHYSENLIGLGYARDFGPNLRIGLKLDYLFFLLSNEYKNKSAPTFEIGIQYQINKSLCIGVYAFNPINIKTKSLNKDKIPIVIRLGLSYYINDDFFITSEIEENSEHNFSYRFGVEYEIYKNIYIRSGFQLKPELLTFGFGYNLKWLHLDISAQMNQILGASLSCSFVFEINKRKLRGRIAA